MLKGTFLFHSKSGHDHWLVKIFEYRGRINQSSTNAVAIMCPLPKTARTTSLQRYIPQGQVGHPVVCMIQGTSRAG
jgi:hypothetical protein